MERSSSGLQNVGCAVTSRRARRHGHRTSNHEEMQRLQMVEKEEAAAPEKSLQQFGPRKCTRIRSLAVGKGASKTKRDNTGFVWKGDTVRARLPEMCG